MKSFSMIMEKKLLEYISIMSKVSLDVKFPKVYGMH